MKLTKLSLINFRNYTKINITLNNKMNIFIGKNAQGKTNILESICILALTKSHRVGVNPNIIQFNKKKCIIRGIVKNNDTLNKLEVNISNDNKNVLVNSSKKNKLSEYISNLNIIIFTPDDLDIIKGGPNIRRNLLNIELSQISKLYLNTYNEYNKILKMRNEYLKVLFNNSLSDKKYLDIITDQLIEKAVIIYQQRNIFLNLISNKINDYYRNISNDSGLSLLYKPNIEIKSFATLELRKLLKEVFTNNYKKELNYGMTLFGPHRDDFIFLYNNNDLKYFGSQGQQKLAVLSFKLSEIPIFLEYNHTNPVLLLDDIFSELDIKKRNKLLKIINNQDIQSVLTTTDLKNINKKYLNDSYIYEVINGIIKRK